MFLRKLIIQQGFKQILKTVNDPKFDLMTLRTLTSKKFQQGHPQNPKNITQEVPIKLKFSNLTLAFGEIFFLKLSPKVKQ